MNTEQKRALLPCPFCGGKPRISKQMGESIWSHDIVLWTQVQCDECEAHVGPTCEGFQVEAVDIWNRRAALQSQDREDAERYHLLRRGQHWSVTDGIGDTLRAEALDAAIDHARRVEGEGE